MSLPYPLIRIEDEAKRARFLNDVLNMGLSFAFFAPGLEPKDNTFSIDDCLTHLIVCSQGDEAIWRPAQYTTWVNSPRHFLAYVKRMMTEGTIAQADEEEYTWEADSDGEDIEH